MGGLRRLLARVLVEDRCPNCGGPVVPDEMGWLDDLDGSPHECWAWDQPCSYCPGSYRVVPDGPPKGQGIKAGWIQPHDCAGQAAPGAYPPRYRRGPVARLRRRVVR